MGQLGPCRLGFLPTAPLEGESLQTQGQSPSKVRTEVAE